MMAVAGLTTHYKTVHQLNVILIINIDAVLLVDGVVIHRLIVHVAVVLITEYNLKNGEMIYSADQMCCPCPFIQILSRFYPDFIQILSIFFKNSFYPNFIHILS